MIGTEPLLTAGYAALIVGIVLIEAVVLYVGYGFVERVFAPPVFKRLQRL